jgi:hypothetical protein
LKKFGKKKKKVHKNYWVLDFIATSSVSKTFAQEQHPMKK